MYYVFFGCALWVCDSLSYELQRVAVEFDVYICIVFSLVVRSGCVTHSIMNSGVWLLSLMYYVFLHLGTHCKAVSLIYVQFIDGVMSVLFQKLSVCVCIYTHIYTSLSLYVCMYVCMYVCIFQIS